MELLTGSPSVEAGTSSTTHRRRKWVIVAGALAVAGIAVAAVAVNRDDGAPRQGRTGRLAAPSPTSTT